MIGIVVSEPDPASVTIGEALRSLTDWETSEDTSRPAADGGGTVYRHGMFELRRFEDLHLELEDVAAAFTDPEAVLFVSRHAGQTGRLLTTHVPGNVGEAAYGGSPHTLPAAAPGLLRAVHAGLVRYAPEEYEVGIECTHHGPSTVGAPTLFVEVGSDETAWADMDAAAAVAQAVLAVEGVDPVGERTVVGFGGGHYAPRFERILRETDWQVGHIAADWGLEEITETEARTRVVAQAIERSQADIALVTGEHPEVVAEIEATGVRVVGETWLRETDGVPLSVVEEVEAMLGPIEEGTRLGAVWDAERLEPTALPPEVVEAVNGYSAGEALEAVATQVGAFVTEEGGSRLSGPLALPAGTDLVDVLEALRPVLEARYEAVTIEEDGIALRHREFDPAAARNLGIPEGPAFGRLANGEPVTVDGTEVSPDEVTREVTREIPLGRD